MRAAARLARAGVTARWMGSRGISWTAWKLDNCTDLSCYFKSDGVSVDGNWTDADMYGHGPFVRDRMRE